LDFLHSKKTFQEMLLARGFVDVRINGNG